MSDNENTRSFLRQNPLIVASIALPLLVVVLFVLASTLPKLFTDAPRHDLVFVVPHYGTAGRVPASLDVVVDEGRVVAVVRNKHEQAMYPVPVVFRYEAADGDVSRLDIELPDDWSGIESGETFAVTGLDAVRIDTSVRAPDGYEFRDAAYRGGLIFEVFGVRGRRQGISVVKNGAVHRIPVPGTGDRWYGQAIFLGWAVD